MLKKTLAIVGATAVIVGGAGTAAIAASGTTTPARSVSSSTPTSDTSASSPASDTLDTSAASPASDASGASVASPASDTSAMSLASDSSVTTPADGAANRVGRRGRVNRLRRAVHATWVTENKQTKVFTTHDAIAGRVTAVSPTSITVQASDSVIQTYVLTSGTKVRTRANRSTASIADVKTGDPVFVGGTGTSTLTAVRVIDARK